MTTETPEAGAVEDLDSEAAVATTDGKVPMAVIFIPAVAERTDQSVQGVARRLALALDRNDPDATAAYSTDQEGREEEFGAARVVARVRTIHRSIGDAKAPVLDVVQMAYAPVLTEPFKKRSAVSKAARIAATVAFNVGRVVVAIVRWRSRRAKKAREELQVLFGILVLGLFAAYMAILGFAIADTVVKLVDQGDQVQVTQYQLNGSITVGSTRVGPTLLGPQQKEGDDSGEADKGEPDLGFLQVLALLLTAAGVITPTRVKEWIGEAASDYIGSVEYLANGTARDELVGQLADLVDHLEASQRYERLVVIGYSWGSVIAIDALFPPRRQPQQRMSAIDTLITIGCPYDLIRTFWPHYYDNRTGLADTPDEWLNVWSPMDALASNFRDDDALEDATCSFERESGAPITPKNAVWEDGPIGEKLTISKAFALWGLRAHALYWLPDINRSDSEL